MSLEISVGGSIATHPYRLLSGWKRALLRENQTRWSTDKYTREGSEAWRMIYEASLPWEESAAISTRLTNDQGKTHHCLCSFDDSPGPIIADPECRVHGQNDTQLSERFFVFDVESIGLYGEGFAASFVVVDRDGMTVDEGYFACKPERAQGTEEDRAWVMEHVAPHLGQTLYAQPSDVRYGFWNAMRHWIEAGALIFADCAAPVAARFLAARMTDYCPPDAFEGPYPLHDVATVLLCAGMDPLATYDRLPSELPAHNALHDARQSARLLLEALGQLEVNHHAQ